jgi:hypothetical protein
MNYENMLNKGGKSYIISTPYNGNRTMSRYFLFQVAMEIHPKAFKYTAAYSLTKKSSLKKRCGKRKR